MVNSVADIHFWTGIIIFNVTENDTNAVEEKLHLLGVEDLVIKSFFVCVSIQQ